MRTPFRNVMIGLLGGATAVAGSWLLLAEPSLGRTPNGERAKAARAKTAVRPRSHGYGGYSGACVPGSFKPLSAPESFIKRSKFRCFESSGNPTGDNPDLSSEAFLASEDGTVVNMTKDTRRCVDGPNNGMTCVGYGSCPQGRCEDMTVLACAGDARGHTMFFIFDGNPTGKNVDLGDELFAFDIRTRQLTQLTEQRGWCADDPSHACDKSSDCTGGLCVRARMLGRTFFGYGRSAASGLEVSPDGSTVWFVTDGDPGGNPTHAVTQFALAAGKSQAPQAIGSGGKFCSSRSKHPGMPCVTAVDCGPICGDGRKDPSEECETFAFPPTCPTGEFCQRPGLPNECTCVTPVCGNGIIEVGEVCELPAIGCLFGRHCNATCTGCVTSPSGAFLDPMP